MFQEVKQKALSIQGLFVSFAFAMRFVSSGLNLLFPPRCAGCGRLDTYWCEQCQQEISQLHLNQEIIPKPPLIGVTATAWHIGKIREAVQALKYENVPKAAIPLGNKLTESLLRQDWIIDIIVPVPLHTNRLAERGYNQSQLLAEQVALRTGIRCEEHALKRTRETQSQVTISGAERLVNIRGAFSAESTIVKDQSILVIDDVYTTGSTMSACGEALLEAGAKGVYGLTVTAAGHSITHKKELADEYHYTRA